ncbi:unnamed protein product [Rotaria socialis]|uniref:Uncharacterized protein n=1 Tax=Rotaria socialis TaxID=392032 RepID=A0A817X4D0_9BILA|nr:unnamed protein product [Rotaria socialis]CAF4566626.1 unnamed protein product [Rotaria socialis]CAF4810220.1 unnamed protein product [Rotaria socialis]
MAKTNQVSIWEVSTNDRHNKLNSHVDDDEEGRPSKYQRSLAAFENLKCCCSCSSPIFIGFVIGALVAGIVLATVVSIYVVDSVVRRRLALRLLAQQQLQPPPQQRLQPLLRQLLAQQQLRPVQLQRLQPQRLQQVRALPLQALQALPLQPPAQQQLRPVQPQRLRAPLPLAQQQLLQQVHHQHRLVLQLRLLQQPQRLRASLPLAQQQLLQQVHHQHRLVLQLRLLQQPQLLRQALLHQLHQCRRQLQLVLPQQPLQQQHHKQQRVQLQVQQQHQLQLRQQRLVRCTTCVTFDNIPGQLATTGVVPNGYNNLNWTNVWYVNASTEPTSGYEYAVTSPPFVGTNPGGATVKITSANGTSFAFDSVIVTSAWRDDLYWVIYGYRNGVNTVAGGFYMQVANQTIISCGSCTNLDTLYFVVSGGTPHVGLAQTGYESAFDNLCISFGY